MTTTSSIRSVLTQLPAPPPPQPVRPLFGSQPPAWTPLSQQDGAQGLLGNGYGCENSQSQSLGGREVGDRPLSPSSSSSSSHVSFSISDSTGYQSAPSLTSSSSVLPPPPPPSQTSMNPAPKLVPIFKNKHPSRHINVALLRVQKQREQLRGGGEERRRVTLPAFGKLRPVTAPSSAPSSSFASLPVPPPPFIPRFNRRPKPQSSTAPQPSAHPRIKHISSLSPASKANPGFILTPKPEMKLKSRSSPKTSVKTTSENHSSCKLQEKATNQPSAAPPEPPQPPTSCDASSSSREVSPSFRLLKIMQVITTFVLLLDFFPLFLLCLLNRLNFSGIALFPDLRQSFFVYNSVSGDDSNPSPQLIDLSGVYLPHSWCNPSVLSQLKQQL